MKNYISLYKSNKEFRILLIVLIISQFGFVFSQTGIFTLLTQINAPVWAISFTAMMSFLPPAILAPLSGVIIEKYPKITLLKILLIIEAMCVLSMVLIDDYNDLIIFIILILFRMSASSIYFQCEKTLMPLIVKNSDLIRANELHSMIWSACYTTAMLISGVVIYKLGVKISFVIDFIFFLISLILVAKLNFQERLNKNYKPMIKDGLLYLFKHKELLYFVILHAIIGATSYDALITLLAKFKYSQIIAIPIAIGFMNGIKALGISIGPILLSNFTNQKSIFYIFIAQFLGISLWAMLQFNFYLALIGLFFTGLFTTTLWSYTLSKIQMLCSDNFRGRIIAWIDTFYLGIASLTSYLIGKFYEIGLSPQMITIIIGLAFVFGAFFYKAKIS